MGMIGVVWGLVDGFGEGSYTEGMIRFEVSATVGEQIALTVQTVGEWGWGSWLVRASFRAAQASCCFSAACVQPLYQHKLTLYRKMASAADSAVGLAWYSTRSSLYAARVER